MPEQERNEPPTPRRREQARRRGQVFRSREVTSTAVLLCALLVLWATGPSIRALLAGCLSSSLASAGTARWTETTMARVAIDAARVLALTCGPVLAAVFLAGLLSGVAQVGILATAEPLAPRLSRLDPIQGWRRIFSLRSLVDLARSLLKLGLIGWVAWKSYESDLPAALALVSAHPENALAEVARAALQMAMKVALLSTVLAFLDFLYQKWEHERGLRMTRQELREEHQQNEGDPQIRARRRERMRRLARGRMVAQVPTANAVLTNPVHYAVAFRYDEATMSAPMVVAKGAGDLAWRIQEAARRHGIPVLQRPALARLLFRKVEVGRQIPPSLYEAMAEIVAWLQDERED